MTVICTKPIKIRWEWGNILNILANTPIPVVGDTYVIEDYLSFRHITFYKLKGFNSYFESTYFEFVDQSNNVNDDNAKELVMELVTSKIHLN